MPDISLFKGAKLYDKRLDRTVILEGRVNPQGVEVKPYWTVRNTKTDKVTLIREDRIDTPRWSRAS